ncbi:MAG: integration host factor subunit alpha [Alphaproteobacteria bacterium]|nr:integration host factor subunit alpha [Alphaproteobacteria bacterium]
MNNTVTRTDIIKAISDKIGLTANDASKVLECVVDEIITELSKGSSVSLSLFGRFDVHDKKKRAGRNPKTGKPAEISARRTVSFSPSLSLRALVAGNVPVDGK